MYKLIHKYIYIYIYIKYIRLAWEDTPRCSGIVPCRPHAMACSNFVQISNFLLVFALTWKPWVP